MQPLAVVATEEVVLVRDVPGAVLIGTGVATAGVAFALLMVVMRGLLRMTTMLRRELDEVV